MFIGPNNNEDWNGRDKPTHTGSYFVSKGKLRYITDRLRSLQVYSIVFFWKLTSVLQSITRGTFTYAPSWLHHAGGLLCKYQLLFRQCDHNQSISQFTARKF